MKKLLCVLLTAGMMCGLATPALADEGADTVATENTMKEKLEADKEGTAEYWYVMHKGSNFVYKSESGGEVQFCPMVANGSGDVIEPKIIDDNTYLPLRYVLEDILGFEDRSKSNEKLSDNTFKVSTYDLTNKLILEIKLKHKEGSIRLTQNTIKSFTVKNEDGTIDTYDNLVELKIVDGVSYVPLRLFQAEGINLCTVDYDAPTASIIVAASQLQKKNAETYIQSRYSSNTGMSYSDVVFYKNEVQALQEVCQDPKAYSASNTCNLAIYSGADQKVFGADLERDPANKSQIKFYEKIDDVYKELDCYIDKLTVYGDKIYGLRAKGKGEISGDLFTAKLKVVAMPEGNGIWEVTTNNGENIQYGLQAVDYSEYTYTNNILLYDVEADPATGDVNVYYVEDYTLKKYDEKSGKRRDVLIDGEPLTNIDYFAVGMNDNGNHIVYNDFKNAEIKVGKLTFQDESDQKDLVGIISDVELAAYEGKIQFICYDRENNNCFYYNSITNEPNLVNKLTFTSEGKPYVSPYYSADKIRNIAVINGQVCAKVNDEFKKNIQPNSWGE